METAMRYQAVCDTDGYATRDVDDPTAIVARAQRCLAADWPGRACEERAPVLTAVAARLRASRDQLAMLRSRDMGALRAEACADVDLAADILERCAIDAADHLRPRPVPHGPYQLAPHPLGIILGIDCTPMSYAHLARFVGPNLMAGNVVIVMSKLRGSYAARAFGALFDQVGAPAGLYGDVTYDIDRAMQLIDDTRLRGVHIAGRSGEASLIAEHAKSRHRRVVQETSRNHALLVLEDAPLDTAIERIMAAASGAAPLSSVSARRVIIVGHERARTLIEMLQGPLRTLKPGHPSDAATTLGPLPSQRALDIFLHHIQVARVGGARLALGGERDPRPGFFAQPTILTELSVNDPISSLSIHGPIVTVHATASVEEAIEAAKVLPTAAGSLVLAGDPAAAAAVARRLPAQFGAEASRGRSAFLTWHPTRLVPEGTAAFETPIF
jgi:succinate-semialdehyde dehydrogenase / glutarate-semialdehyde dehydrogenase